MDAATLLVQPGLDADACTTLILYHCYDTYLKHVIFLQVALTGSVRMVDSVYLTLTCTVSVPQTGEGGTVMSRRTSVLLLCLVEMEELVCSEEMVTSVPVNWDMLVSSTCTIIYFVCSFQCKYVSEHPLFL